RGYGGSWGETVARMPQEKIFRTDPKFDPKADRGREGVRPRSGEQRELEIADFHQLLSALERRGTGAGGEGGIRTHDTVARMPHFECGAFDLSATSPRGCCAVAWAAGGSE